MLADPLHRWTIDEYYRMGDMGMFDDCHVELIEGVVVEMCPVYSAHATVVTKALRVMFRVFGDSAVIRP